MIPLLTQQAVEKKCDFEHVILLGDYELCYSLGVIAKAAGLDKESEFSHVGQLKEKVLKATEGFSPKDIRMERLYRIASEMDAYTDNYDDQMYQLYSVGYDKGHV